MAALDFPSSPSVGQQYPSPAVSGVPVYTWDGEKWTTKGGAIGSTGASDAVPAIDSGSGGAGSSTLWSRGDHFHPVDPSIATGLASKAPIASPVFTGNPTAPTPAYPDNDTSIATTAFVKNCVPIASGVDLNTVIDPGSYFTVANNNPNTPFTDYWFLYVMRYDSGSTIYSQLAICPMAVGNASVWYRTNNGGGWKAWARLQDSTQLATLAEYIANAAGKILTPAAVWGAANNVGGPSDSSGTIAVDMGLYLNFYWGLTGAGRTVANPTNTKVGQSGMILIGTGSGTITTWGSSWKFAGGIKPVTTAAGGYDWMWYTVYNSSYVICSYLNDIK